MSISWKKEYNTELICQRIRQAAVKNEKGNISYPLHLYIPIILIMKSAVNFDDSINEEEKSIIIDKAITHVAGDNITLKKLTSALSFYQTSFLNLENKKYILITSIAIDKNSQIKPQRINNCFISFHKNLDSNFESARKEIMASATSSVTGKIPKNYTIVKIHSSGRTQSEAFNNAWKAINIYRAKINL